MGAPTVTFESSGNRLGANAYIEVEWSADVATQAFEARATRSGSPYGVGVGLLVGAFSSTPAGVQRTFEIYDTELTQGDGAYRISLFAQGTDGVWNDNCGLHVSGGDVFADANGDAVLVLRGSTTQESYTSAYTGPQLDAFLGGVL